MNLRHQLDHCDHHPTSYHLLEIGKIDLKYKNKYKTDSQGKKQDKHTNVKLKGLDTKMTLA